MLARAWGCTPAQLRACTLAELNAMTDLLLEQQAADRKARRG